MCGITYTPKASHLFGPKRKLPEQGGGIITVTAAHLPRSRAALQTHVQPMATPKASPASNKRVKASPASKATPTSKATPASKATPKPKASPALKGTPKPLGSPARNTRSSGVPMSTEKAPPPRGPRDNYASTRANANKGRKRPREAPAPGPKPKPRLKPPTAVPEEPAPQSMGGAELSDWQAESLATQQQSPGMLGWVLGTLGFGKRQRV